MVVEDGILTIRAGQRVAEYDNDNTSVRVRELRRSNVDVDGIVCADVRFSSPSQAGAFATGRSSNGWWEWKTADGQSINIFRAHQNSSSQS